MRLIEDNPSSLSLTDLYKQVNFEVALSRKSYLSMTVAFEILPIICTIIVLKSVCLSVGVRKLQVAILARSSREMYLTVRIVWKHILSRVCVSVRPSIFYMRKTLKTSGKPGCQCLFQWPATSYYHQRSGPSPLVGTDPSNSDTVTAVCVSVGDVCARVRAGACARMCVRPCVRDVFAIYDNNIWPTLIMIIIKKILFHMSYKSDTLMISPQRVPG